MNSVQQDDLNLYAKLMDRVKVRMAAISGLLRTEHPWPPAITQDSCYLQLRLVCETIAVACLVAHGDVASRKLRGEYQADKILNALERLHPRFYPRPHIERLIGPGRHRIEVLGSGHLTKADFIAIYRKCGDALHIGSLNKVQAIEQVNELEDIDGACIRIADLLSAHHISLSDGKSIFCTMKTGPKDVVQVVRTEPIPEGGRVVEVTELPPEA